MLKIRVVAVGDIKENFYRDAIAEYAKRLGRWAKTEITEVPEASRADTPDKKREEEGAEITKRLKGKVILLDVKGKKISSEGIADLLRTSALAGDSELTFVIGGSNGVSKAVKDAANEILSFGEITLPHQLFRVVLLEQLYRGMAIIAGTPYHK